mgnify:CR=1 FL=1
MGETNLEGVQQFLNAVANIDKDLASYLSVQQIESISESLADWVYEGGGEGSTIVAEVGRQLRERLGIQLGAIDEELAAFVDTVGEGLKQQNLERFSAEAQIATLALSIKDVVDIVEVGVDTFRSMAVEGEHLTDTIIRTLSQMRVVQDVTDRIGLNFSDLGNDMVKVADNIIKSVGGIDQFGAYAQSYINNFDPVTQGEMFNSLAKSLGDVFRDLNMEVPYTRDGFKTLVESLDLTTESGQKAFSALLATSEGMSQFYAVLEQTSASIDSLRGLSKSIQEELMSPQQYYDYLKDQAHSLSDMITTLTDPEQIASTTAQIESLVSNMWGTLDEGQKQLMGGDFISYLDEVANMADEQLALVAQSATSGMDMQDMLNKQVAENAERMVVAGDKMSEAASGMVAAANTINQAAANLQNITITVNNQQAGSSEVQYA